MDVSVCSTKDYKAAKKKRPPLVDREVVVNDLEDKENQHTADRHQAKRRVSFASVNANQATSQVDKENQVMNRNTSNISNSVNNTETAQEKMAKKPMAVNNESPTAHALNVINESFMQVVLNQKVYAQIGILGKGGSSCVHRIINEKGQVYAYKKVNVSGNDESDAVFDSYTNEIDLLRRLKGSPCIIELVDAEINRDEMYIAMIMEAGEIDLSKVLKDRQNQKNVLKGGGLMNPFFSRMVWQEMLEAVDHIHENRIVHGDLKPANFVFVKGHLKLIDFGIAKAISNDTTNIYRESQIGTINYMAPEAIAPCIDPTYGNEKEAKMKLGRASDIWSLGCILYQIIYGRPPFAALNTIQKLHSIPNPNFEISYPAKNSFDESIDSAAVDSIKACLIRNPRLRVTIGGQDGLLNKVYLNYQKYQSTITANTVGSTLALLKAKLGAVAGAEEVLASLDSQGLVQDVQRSLTDK